MTQDESYAHLTDTKHKGSKSSSKAEAARLKGSADAVNAYLARAQQQLVQEEQELAQASTQSQRGYPYDRPPSSATEQRGYPYDRPVSSTVAGQQKGYPYDRPGLASSSSTKQAAEEVMQQAKEAFEGVRSMNSKQEAAARRMAESKLLQDMFKAVWPDLGGFKSWSSASRVAAMSGSFSLSLAFLGAVWYMSGAYDKMREGKGREEESKPRGA